MINLSGKNILFFCPKFFNYQVEIKIELEKLGAKVWWFDDRPSNSFISKVLLRINKNIIRNRINKYYRIIIEGLLKQNLKYDYVLFVNPEAVTLNSISLLKKEFSQAKFILYMWDSMNNRRNNLELLPFFDRKFTFDSNDVISYGMTLRALFYIDPYKEVRENHSIYDLTFIGTMHTDRYKFVKKIIFALKGEYKTYIYFYLNSKILFLLKKITDKNFSTIKIKEISFKSLNHDDIASMIAKSRIVLDINHPKQVGLTIRTFETLASQKKLITTNEEVKKYDFYNENNILIIDRETPIIDTSFFDKPFIPYSEEILFEYSIHGWAQTLFAV